MKHSAIKLTNIIPNYTVFEENQVLTDDQLNTFMLYLDQQDRVSRLYLHGYGIVCGLKTGLGASNTITISKGCCITTDGDLLCLPEGKSFARFSAFDDKEAKYPLFEKTKVYELVSENEKPVNKAYSLRSFKRITKKNLNDYAILFYLESYLHDPDICTGADCDNKGMFQMNKKRFILIEKTVLDKAAFRFNGSKQYFKLENVSIPRLKLGANGVDNYNALVTNYTSVINTGLKDFTTKLIQSGTTLKPFLDEHFNAPGLPEKWARLTTNKISVGIGKKLRIQYVYDFIKDLGLAYNEFIEAFYNWETECMPAPDASPKHIALGDALARVPDVQDPYYQGFVQSPALNQSGEKLKKAIFLFNRIGEIIEHFNNKSYNRIKITPSLNGNHQLGDLSIPFYYEMDKKRDLYNTWSFSKNQKARATHIHSYHAKAYSEHAATIDPMSYDLDAFDFFRIEGHLGMNIKTANTRLQKIINDNNLPVKVVPLILEKALEFIYFHPTIRYNGMDIMHKIYRDGLINNLNELKRFNINLKSTIGNASEDDLPEPGEDSNNMSFRKFTNDQVVEVNKQIDKTKKLLAKPINNFKTTDFEINFKQLVGAGALLNKNVKKITKTTSFTPLEKTINNIDFSNLKRITDNLKIREDKIKEQSVFNKFIEEHPGIEHLGGVPKGGTFIMIYSSSDSKVIADFCLPYYYYEQPEQEIAEDSDPGDDNFIFDWKLHNNLLIHLNQTHYLKEKIQTLDSKYDLLNLNFVAQTANLSAQFGGINNAIQAIPNFVGDFTIQPAGPGAFVNPDMQNDYEMIQDIGKARDYYANKVKEGRATNHDKAMLENLEDTASGAIENIITSIAKGSDDIVKGSQHENAITVVLSNAAKLSGAAKTKVTAALNTSKALAAGKTNMSNVFSMYNF